MCRHDVVNIQHAHCGLVGPTAKRSRECLLPATGITTQALLH